MLGYITGLAVLLGAASAGVVVGGYEEGLGVGVGGLGVGVGVVGGHHGVVDLHTPAKYEFKYGVEDPKTGDRKQQSEVRVNDVVKGEYSLAEPDGTIRVVKYTADDHNGFNAVVSRVGHAAHPQVLIKKVVPVAHHVALPVAHHVAVPVAHHVVPVATHGIAVGGIGLGGGLLDGRGGYGLEGGLLGGRGGIGLGLEGGRVLDGHDGLLGGGLLGRGGYGYGGI